MLKLKINLIFNCSGYMAPEYVIHGQFSTKSDVFAYGVLILEIVTGQRNNARPREANYSESLLSYVSITYTLLDECYTLLDGYIQYIMLNIKIFKNYSLLI